MLSRSPTSSRRGPIALGRGGSTSQITRSASSMPPSATCGGRPHLLRNDGGSRANWLSLSTVGTRSNRDGLGATIVVTGESGLSQRASVTTGSSYLSASDKRVAVGLGRDTVARRVTIRWPSGLTQTLRDVPANRALTLRESNAR